LKSCVAVDGDGDGDTADEDLTREQISQFSTAYHDFIVSNPGRDIGDEGTIVTGTNGIGESYVSSVRVASQFVGSRLRYGWQNTTITVGSIDRKTLGRLDPIYDPRTGQVKSYDLRIDPTLAGMGNNPSSTARVLTHEYLHRPDQLGPTYSYSEQHLNIDNVARRLIKNWGLANGGCPAYGSRTWLGFGPPFYPGCD
jgi:hypothetical protein